MGNIEKGNFSGKIRMRVGGTQEVGTKQREEGKRTLEVCTSCGCHLSVDKEDGGGERGSEAILIPFNGLFASVN